jgi:DNA-binding NarL/FixJ family response regulator
MTSEGKGSTFRKALPSILPALAVVGLQVVACIYFVADAMSDEADASTPGSSNWFEVVVALALLAGVAMGAAYIFRLIREVRQRDAAITIARGALSELLAQRFNEWSLSAAEADVAHFALKGCSISEIARMRSAATGTVRAQLSQVYAKAGVSSQAMLMSLFLDDLMTDQDFVGLNRVSSGPG